MVGVKHTAWGKKAAAKIRSKPYHDIWLIGRGKKEARGEDIMKLPAAAKAQRNEFTCPD